jgi:hypothetical protein
MLKRKYEDIEHTVGSLKETVDVMKTATALMGAALASRLIYNTDAATPPADVDPEYRRPCIDYYGQAKYFQTPTPELICCLLNVPLPAPLVHAAHLFKQEWKHPDLMQLVGIDPEDIHNPKNLLLFSEPVEWAFDRGKLIFVKDGDDFVCRILDNSILRCPLWDRRLFNANYAGTSWNGVSPEKLPAMADITYRDLDHRKLTFQNPNRPWKRALCFQARLSRNESVKCANYEHIEFADYWSEDDMEAKVRDYLLNHVSGASEVFQPTADSTNLLSTADSLQIQKRQKRFGT